MPEGTTRHASGVRLQECRGQWVERQYGLGFVEGAAQFPVVFRRADSGQGSFRLVERPRSLAALRQAAAADLGRGKLVARALRELSGSPEQQPQVIERAKAFLGLEPQQVGVFPHGLGQVSARFNRPKQ